LGAKTYSTYSTSRLKFFFNFSIIGQNDFK
jgi:hypothetical protein